MDDTTNVDMFKSTPVIKVDFNDKEIELIKLCNVGKARQGIKTGDNHYYIYQKPQAKGNYKSIEAFRNFILREEEIEKISNDEKLRIKLIEKGIHKSKYEKKIDKDLFFNGRYIVYLDKGGESNIELGWLPSYYVLTSYFIDWSSETVNRMKTLTIKERDGMGCDKICSRFQNVEFSFKEGITFSPTGIYAPTFRINTKSIFESKGSVFFQNKSIFSYYYLLGLLNSKLLKYIMKNYISHSVEFGEGAIQFVIITKNTNDKIITLVSSIIQKQKQNPRYDYMTNEQVEIDKLVYEVYNLNEEDIKEVENWYFRRYPKLAKAIEEELKRKNDD